MTDIDFKFHWVGENGQQVGFFSKKGNLSGNDLTLDDTTLPVGSIVDVDTRGNILVLGLVSEDDEPIHAAIQTSKAGKLKSELGVRRSATWAELHRKELQEKGLGHTFREETCPSCTATIDLSNKEPTPQMSCDFCHTISLSESFDHGPQTPNQSNSETGYRICDECGMYSKPRKFTIFYFYFLLYVYGWRSQTTWRCPGCMRGEAWKMLGGNLIFILGVPVALVQLFRSYGGTDIGALYKGLDKANLKARKQDLGGAIEIYQNILRERPTSAGVKYNVGLAMLQQNRTEEAARMFEYALADCANYHPAAAVLAGCYETLNETDKLAALHEKWGDDVEDENAIHEAEEIESE